MKKFFASVLTLVLLLTLAIPTQASSAGISVFYNEEKLDLAQPAFVEKGKTYVPLRSFFEELDYEVRYNKASNTIELDYDSYISLVELDTKQVIEEDEIVIEKLDLIKRNNTYYAPVRELEPVTITITKWNAATKSVYIVDDWSGIEIDEEIEEEREPSEGFLWKVSKGQNIVYMLGSIHAGTDELYPLRDEIYDAFAESEVLVTEVNTNVEPTADVQAEIEKLTTYQDGTTLKDHLSADTYKELMSLFETMGVTGQDLEDLNKTRVWVINNVLSVNVITDTAEADLGIESHFHDLAELKKLPEKELETYMIQYNMLAGFSDSLQEELLLQSMEAVKQMLAGTLVEDNSGMEILLDLWIQGDLESFDEMANEQKAMMPEYYDGLLTKRNVGMTDKIEEYLNSTEYKTFFVIAGTLHFAGEDSIIAMLEKRGYTVERL